MAAHPFVGGGGPSNQSIFDVVTSPRHEVGTRGRLTDGRVFYYARNSGAAIVAGNLLMSEIVDGDFANETAGAAAAVGSKVVQFNPSGTKVAAANDFAGGYLVVNDAAGEGLTYKVKSHGATTAATDFNVELYDGIVVALTTSSELTLVKNPWMDVVIAAAGNAHMPAGVSPVAVGAGTSTPQYFWCQTWGVCAGWDDASTAIGSPLQSGTTAGQFEIQAEGAGALGSNVGIQLFTGVATEYYPKFLRIAP